MPSLLRIPWISWGWTPAPEEKIFTMYRKTKIRITAGFSAEPKKKKKKIEESGATSLKY